MLRRISAPLLACLTTLSLGCCMCDAPYDYCYPPYAGDGCGDRCRTHERINSAFTGPVLAEGEHYESLPTTVEPSLPTPGPEPYYLDEEAQHAPPQTRAISNARPKRQVAKKAPGLFGSRRFVWIERPGQSR